MRRLVCRGVRTTLAARVLDEAAVPAFLEGHVSRCLRCQAVVAQSLRLRRSLAGLGPHPPVEPIPVPGPGRWVAAGVASAAAVVVVARLRQQGGDAARVS